MPAAEKKDDRAAAVIPAGEQGAGLPGMGGKEDTTAEGGGTSGSGATQNKKRTADGAGKSSNWLHQRLVYSAKKK